MSTIRLPLTFYRDHQERDLPTPENLSRSKSYAVVAADDPFLPELLNDARHYADRYMASEFRQAVPGVVMSAAATVKAIEKGGVR